MLVVIGVVVLEQVEQCALKHVLGETLLLDDLTERREIDGQLQKIKKKKKISPCQRERERKKKNPSEFFFQVTLMLCWKL